MSNQTKTLHRLCPAGLMPVGEYARLHGVSTDTAVKRAVYDWLIPYQRIGRWYFVENVTPFPPSPNPQHCPGQQGAQRGPF